KRSTTASGRNRLREVMSFAGIRARSSDPTWRAPARSLSRSGRLMTLTIAITTQRFRGVVRSTACGSFGGILSTSSSGRPPRSTGIGGRFLIVGQRRWWWVIRRCWRRFLQPTVETFEYQRSDLRTQVHFIGPLLPASPTALRQPDWWDELADKTRPVVLVTQGTVATDARALIAPALRGLASRTS